MFHCWRRKSPPKVKLCGRGPEDFERDSVGLVARRGILGFAQRGDAVGEVEGGRTPVERVLIVAGDAGGAGDVEALREERHVARGVAAELIAEVDEELRPEGVTPVDGGGVVELAAGGQKAEEIGIIGARALQLERAGEIVLAAQLADGAELQAVLMEAADDGQLIVVAGLAAEVRQRIEVEQGLRLRADAVQRNTVAGDGKTGGGVDRPGRVCLAA